MKKHDEFFVDFLNKKICGTKELFDMAGKGDGADYDKLMGLMEKHPTYELMVVASKRPAKVKETYSGCSLTFIKDYVAMIDNPKYVKEMNNIIADCDNNGVNPLPKLKSWMIDTFKCSYENERFSMATAKENVRKWKLDKAKAGLPASAASNEASLAKAA